MKAKDYRRQIEQQLADSIRPQDAGLKMERPSLESEWDRAIALLLDSHGSKAVDRLQALQTLQAGAVLGVRFAPFRARFLNAMRVTAAFDEDPELRLAAFDGLANIGDPWAQTTLKVGVRQPESALVPLAAAIGLLARDDHASIVELAKHAFETSEDPHVRRQAVRAIGASASEVGFLSDVLKDSAQDQRVRRASAAALQALSPEAFVQSAQFVLDAGQDDDVSKTLDAGLDQSRRSDDKATR